MSINTMTAARVHGPGDLRLDQVEQPTAGPRDVVIRVGAVGICGSDLVYAKNGCVIAPVPEPFGLGHEIAGIIDQVGNEVVGITLGMRVAVNPLGDGNAIGCGEHAGAFAPYLLVQNATLGGSILPLPDGLNINRAALAEPLAVALHAINRAALMPSSKVALFGAGPIGLGIVVGLRRRGVNNIVVFDMSDARLARARALGARVVVNPSREDPAAALARHHGQGTCFGWPVVATEVFFEASGAASVLPRMVAMAPSSATIVLVAVHHEPIAVDFQAVLAKEITIRASMGYPDGELAECLAALADPSTEVDAMVSHRFAFSAFPMAFETAKDRDAAAKVLVIFD